MTRLYAAAGVVVRWEPPIVHSGERRNEVGPAAEDLTVLVLKAC